MNKKVYYVDKYEIKAYPLQLYDLLFVDKILVDINWLHTKYININNTGATFKDQIVQSDELDKNAIVVFEQSIRDPMLYVAIKVKDKSRENTSPAEVF